VKKTRAELRENRVAAIMKIAKRLIGKHGASGLSLRQVAREMGIVSSALYRYFATRDELLTALIIDAYDDLGAAVERADAECDRTNTRERWRASAGAIRKWAKKNPDSYGLIYGTPVADYDAPDVLTIPPATRVTRVLGRILSDDHSRRSRRRTRRAAPASAQVQALDLTNLAEQIPNVPAEAYVGALMAWIQIFGFVSFELFGHLDGSVRDADAMFDLVVAALAEQMQLSN
jgi:AcrR family transcriptional regulator